MPLLDSTEERLATSEPPAVNKSCFDAPDSSCPGSGSPAKWNVTTYGALLALVVLWAIKVYTTWAAWGNLTIDSGHEMYVPELLAEGKMLYRDVWFLYGPLAPYFNSVLFRVFGLHLDVLYWAGSLSALGSAIFLYLCGLRLSSWLVGWTAGAVVLMEAFQPTLFCFPLPYGFAAVYGCLVGCLFLWLVISACTSSAWPWMLAAGMAAATALLIKLEFGIACYGTLGLLIVVRAIQQKSWKTFATDVAATLPGIAICGLVIRRMVSIAGVEFITQENFMSWPTAYFMKTYGKMWLELTGFTVSAAAFHEALFRLIPPAMALLVAYCCLWWKSSDPRSTLLKALVAAGVAVYFVRDIFLNYLPPTRLEPTLSTVFFPQDMVLYVILAAAVAWAFFLRGSVSTPRNKALRNPAFPLLLTFSSLLAFRILMKMAPAGYPIYYNGPVVLSFLLLLCMIIPRSGRSRTFVFCGELILCLATLAPVTLHATAFEAIAKNFVPLTTERGTIRVSKHLAENYRAAIEFMKDKAAHGEYVLSVPEDTSLYFLSGTYAPSRVFLFTPGVLVPGKMTQDVIRQIEEKPVKYLLWSNRTFPEYGVPVFGKDFDTVFADYLRAHYRRVGPLVPFNGNFWDWTAVVWERKPESGL
jgi:hypothetical protein